MGPKMVYVNIHEIGGLIVHILTNSEYFIKRM